MATWQRAKLIPRFIFARNACLFDDTRRRGRLAAARCALRGTVVMALVDGDPKMHEDDDDQVRCRARLCCAPPR